MFINIDPKISKYVNMENVLSLRVVRESSNDGYGKYYISVLFNNTESTCWLCFYSSNLRRMKSNYFDTKEEAENFLSQQLDAYT